MPPRGKRPGYKFIARTGRHYWIARQIKRDLMGYPDECIPLPLDADEAKIDRLCQDYTASLERWIAEVRANDGEPLGYDARRRYDGSVLSVSRIYQEHPHSKFRRRIKENTRRFYTANLKIVELEVGRRQIRNLTIIDVENWYEQWRKPAIIGHDANGEPIYGNERIDRAHDVVSVFKTALNFCAALRLPHCAELADSLERIQFEKGAAREQQLTSDQTMDFLRAARDLADRGVIDRERALAMSIGVAAQLDLMLRQKDVIGEYPKTKHDLDRAVRRGAMAIRCGERTWCGYFTWENMPGWRFRLRTSKSRYRSAAEYDLTKRSLLFPLLNQVAFAERTGAVVKGSNGLPITEHVYRDWFRRIARAAGIPDDVWSMDARAGGATEAHEAEVPLDLISESLTHSNPATTLRYIRRRSAKLDKVADLVARKRAGAGDEESQ